MTTYNLIETRFVPRLYRFDTHPRSALSRLFSSPIHPPPHERPSYAFVRCFFSRLVAARFPPRVRNFRTRIVLYNIRSFSLTLVTRIQRGSFDLPMMTIYYACKSMESFSRLWMYISICKRRERGRMDRGILTSVGRDSNVFNSFV